MKRWIAILLAMALLCVAALAEGTVKVSGGDTNIRKGPGLGYDIVDVAFHSRQQHFSCAFAAFGLLGLDIGL